MPEASSASGVDSSISATADIGAAALHAMTLLWPSALTLRSFPSGKVSRLSLPLLPPNPIALDPNSPRGSNRLSPSRHFSHEPRPLRDATAHTCSRFQFQNASRKDRTFEPPATASTALS